VADVLRKIGANFVVLVPDDDSNDTLNGSSAGQDGIATTNFTAALWENGEPIGNLTTLEAGPYNLTIDNVSTTGVAGYKVNITLPNRSFYELWIKHSTGMVAYRQEQFDLSTRDEIGSVSRDNVRYDFTVASSPVPARKVATGVLDTLRVRRRYDGAADFSAGNLVSDVTIEFTYETLGDTNPITVEPQ
jgi:hypothetical protein